MTERERSWLQKEKHFTFKILKNKFKLYSYPDADSMTKIIIENYALYYTGTSYIPNLSRIISQPIAHKFQLKPRSILSWGFLARINKGVAFMRKSVQILGKQVAAQHLIEEKLNNYIRGGRKETVEM